MESKRRAPDGPRNAANGAHKQRSFKNGRRGSQKWKSAAGKKKKRASMNGEGKERKDAVADGGSKRPKLIGSKLHSKAMRLKKERRNLPIFQAREALINAVKQNDCLVIVGETGSGKTTQLPQYLLESGFCDDGKAIAVTQPRRVAAVTVAQRVAEEAGCPLGSKVGYSVRFDDKSTSMTRIKYLTDGMLLREASMDPLLSKYSLVILDEAHERTLHTDILFAILKGIRRERTRLRTVSPKSKENGRVGRKKAGLKDLKIIAMSATLQAEQFSEYFGKAPILYVKGRQYPVDIMYTLEPQSDYVDASVTTVLQIHLEKAVPGDILVFLSGQQEIEDCARLLEEKQTQFPPDAAKLVVASLYAAMPQHMQLRAFEKAPHGCRKVVLATNIAETSVTIHGIVYVIDTGVVKVRQNHMQTGIESLIIVPVSKAEAWQRSGRAGRVQPGTCYRLYTEPVFRELRDTRIPEVLRTSLSSVVLQLKALKVDDIPSFDFMSKPPKVAILRALEELLALEALNRNGSLTKPLGIQMSILPLEPKFSKALLSAERFSCTEEVLTVVSVLSSDAGGLFVSPREKRVEAAASRIGFIAGEGDLLTYANVFNGFKKAGSSAQWCKKHYVSARCLRHSVKVRQQLQRILSRLKVPLVSCGKETSNVCKALLCGFFLNAARRQPNGEYRALHTKQEVRIHPSSVLHRSKPESVIFAELIVTSQKYIRDLTIVETRWLSELVPNFFSKDILAQ